MEKKHQMLSMEKNHVVCCHWLRNKCKFGQYCWFRHDWELLPCRYGQNCRFGHQVEVEEQLERLRRVKAWSDEVCTKATEVGPAPIIEEDPREPLSKQSARPPVVTSNPKKKKAHPNLFPSLDEAYGTN